MNEKISNFFAILISHAIICIMMSSKGSAASNAQALLGKARTDTYQCNSVVNEALTGNPIGRMAKDYASFGTKYTGKPEPGMIIVGTSTEGSWHVGIVGPDGNFIHSSSSKMKTISVPMSQLKYIFKSYEVRNY